MNSTLFARRRPTAFHAVLSLAIASVLTVALWHAVSGAWHWAPWGIAWLAAVNLTAMGYYGYDKWQAAREGRRVPEVVLHGLALAGGSMGAFIAMRLFRHKTVKGGFRLIFWLIVAAQIGLTIWLIYHTRTAGPSYN